jgi:hypothetical protein
VNALLFADEAKSMAEQMTFYRIRALLWVMDTEAKVDRGPLLPPLVTRLSRLVAART